MGFVRIAMVPRVMLKWAYEQVPKGKGTQPIDKVVAAKNPEETPSIQT